MNTNKSRRRSDKKPEAMVATAPVVTGSWDCGCEAPKPDESRWVCKHGNVWVYSFFFDGWFLLRRGEQ